MKRRMISNNQGVCGVAACSIYRKVAAVYRLEIQEMPCGGTDNEQAHYQCGASVITCTLDKFIAVVVS